MSGEDRVRALQVLECMKELLKTIEGMSVEREGLDAQLSDPSLAPDQCSALAQRRTALLKGMVEATRMHSKLTSEMLESLGIENEVD